MPLKDSKMEVSRRVEQSLRDKARKNKNPAGSASKSSKGMKTKSSIMDYQQLNNYFRSSRERADGSITISGCDYVGMATGNGIVGYDTIFNYVLSPTSGIFESTRLANIARNYEKYCFKKVRFHVQTGTPTTIGGSYVLSFEKDVSDPLPQLTEAGVRQMMSNLGAKNASISQSLSFDVSRTDTQDFFYTNYSGDDPRLAYQGRLIAMNTTPILSTYSLCLWIEYEILLMDPTLDSIGYSHYDNLITRTVNPFTDTYLNAVNSAAIGTESGDKLVFEQTLPDSISKLSYQAVSSFNVPSGIKLSPGFYIIELLANLANTSASTATGRIDVTCSVKPKVNFDLGSNLTQVLLVPTLVQLMTNASTATQGGDPSYRISSIAAATTVRLITRFHVSIPPGGANVVPLIWFASASVNVDVKDGRFSLMKVDQKAFLARV